MSEKSISTGVIVGGAAGPSATAVAHRRREAPDDHLCTCGRLREICVQECVRAIWR